MNPSKPPALDAAAQAAIAKLADIAVPEPTPWTPQTWGWAVVAALALGAAVWLIVRAVRRRRANRYRVEALADLAALESRLPDAASRPAAMAEIPPLLKRVALAAWPRPDVAALSGDAWVAFLRAHAGRAGLPDAASAFVKDQQYRAHALDAISSDDARLVVDQVRRWIEGHRVRP